MKNGIKKGIFAIMLPLLAANTLTAQTNLFTTNASFEDGKKGWWASDATRVSYTADAAKSGKLGLKVTAKPNTGTGLFSLPDVSPLVTEAGKKYKLTCWVKPTDVNTGLKMRIYEGTFKKGQTELDFASKKLKINEWQQVSFEFKGSALKNGKVNIMVNEGTYLIDDIQIVEVK